MVIDSFSHKINHPCVICSKRKVKCDRLLPCSNCVKHGKEAECLQGSDTKRFKSNTNELDASYHLLWQEYEHWIVKVAIMKNKLNNTDVVYDMKAEIEELEFWMVYLNAEASFKLLDYSMEKLGGLCFGCISDIGELYLKLEEYWARQEDKDYTLSVDDYLWGSLIWSVLTMAIYYIPLNDLSDILKPKMVCEWYNVHTESTWTEELQYNLYYGFQKATILQLKLANFTAFPDIRIIQTFLILCSTSFVQLDVFFADSLLTQCLHISKFLQIDNFRPMVTDSTSLRLNKLMAQKLWYRLSICDYLQSGPNKKLAIHTENESLITHAAYYEELPNVDVYSSEPTFETLLWKLISLDRDLEKYDLRKPTLKSLDAIIRQLDIFSVKVDSIEDTESFSSRFEHFISRLTLNLTYWKVSKLMYVYYRSSTAYDRMKTYTKIIIALILRNIKNHSSNFNKFPYVSYALSLLMGYHSIRNVFSNSEGNEQLVIDLNELMETASLTVQPSCAAVLEISKRIRKLESIWKTVKVIDNDDPLLHPVFKILQNDIKLVRSQFNRIPKIFNYGPTVASENEEDTKEVPEFKAIMKTFEKKYDILKIVYDF
ncbi:Cep3p Ecym_3382 [Eremothecium cymbalariae DBVPG|uniref:Zn(2)-C6 fungal-type domain-containing protein n=1 Tax=Eremothecium cymbalariae (strain CBS 270.75 / DBVPG 7215 / KCTC 17166 / NRRL Y-17582) TaxID=931890 RepID=G8JRV0_ERECY|nr:Hypothetical protein Ecym_3382 [Eremothecium cymbalariae DBVPG\